MVRVGLGRVRWGKIIGSAAGLQTCVGIQLFSWVVLIGRMTLVALLGLCLNTCALDASHKIDPQL